MNFTERICKLTLSLLLLGLLGTAASAAFAQQDQDSGHSSYKYTLASVCGDYGAIATYEGGVARALGNEKADGQGKLTGAAFVNQPGSDSTRTITNIGIAGTYTVNPDGTGKMILTITLPGGSTANVTEDFVITKAKVVDGTAIATAMEDAQEEPSAVIDSSGLVTHSYTLRTAPEACASER